MVIMTLILSLLSLLVLLLVVLSMVLSVLVTPFDMIGVDEPGVMDCDVDGVDRVGNWFKLSVVDILG